MGLFTSMNIGATGLSAQRMNIDVIANNIANANSTRTTEGGPYQRSRIILTPRAGVPVFKSPHVPDALQPAMGGGVKVNSIEKDESPARMVNDPTHPDAITNGKWAGYVAYPNVNIVKEMVNMISANRSYEANVSMIDSSKQMFERALRLGQ
ncbi:MAG: flagellar basal body rod protein FlgC [Spirochaetota bacterium]|nr:flagellar basal body rod protein FlgC [Spirochaetota bacterium]